MPLKGPREGEACPWSRAGAPQASSQPRPLPLPFLLPLLELPLPLQLLMISLLSSQPLSWRLGLQKEGQEGSHWHAWSSF